MIFIVAVFSRNQYNIPSSHSSSPLLSTSRAAIRENRKVYLEARWLGHSYFLRLPPSFISFLLFSFFSPSSKSPYSLNQLFHSLPLQGGHWQRDWMTRTPLTDIHTSNFRQSYTFVECFSICFYQEFLFRCFI